MNELTNTIKKKKKRPEYSRDGMKLFLYSIPFIILIFVFYYLPIYGWVYAFFDYKPGIPLSMTPFVGFKNVIKVLTFSPDLYNAIINTLAMNLLNILASPLPIAFAIMLNDLRSKRFRQVAQTLTTIPNFISWVLVFSVAFAFFSGEGMINTTLQHLGIKYSVAPLANREFTWFFQMLLSIWKGLGWTAIIYLAAMAGIDTELYDAAQVDGAGKFQRIRYITIPGIIPTYLVLLLLNVSNMLSSSFEQYFVFYNPLVASKIEVLDYYVYRLGIIVGNYPMATAVGIFKTVISVTLLFVVNKLSKKLRGSSLI